jgi:hypothetical protein
VCRCCNTLCILLAIQWSKIVIIHLGRWNNKKWATVMAVSYFLIYPTPCTLIITVTLTNHQSNIIQYNFHTFSITITSLYLVLKLERELLKKNHVTRMWLAKHKEETFPAIYFIQNAPTEPWHSTTSNSVAAASGITVLVSRRPFKFTGQCSLHRGDRFAQG